jgi:hypothetical protein
VDKFSSTAVRHALREGRPELAADILGRPFAIEGSVQHGRQLGCVGHDVRAQAGLQSLQTDWVDISRGLGREEAIDPPGALRQMATDELVVRGQFRAWLDYMSEA